MKSDKGEVARGEEDGENQMAFWSRTIQTSMGYRGRGNELGIIRMHSRCVRALENESKGHFLSDSPNIIDCIT